MSEIETRIANKLVRTLLSKGYAISVNDGEETTVRKSRTFGEIKNALQTTDSDILIVYGPGYGRIGSILLIWGNEDDLISDHTDNETLNEIIHRLHE